MEDTHPRSRWCAVKSYLLMPVFPTLRRQEQVELYLVVSQLFWSRVPDCPRLHKRSGLKERKDNKLEKSCHDPPKYVQFPERTEMLKNV